MLVKFDSPVGTLMMFDDVARQCLQLMGHSGTVPSAITEEDVPDALARFEQALKFMQAEKNTSRHGQGESQRVPFKHRALPLSELLRRAATSRVAIQWAYLLPR